MPNRRRMLQFRHQWLAVGLLATIVPLTLGCGRAGAALGDAMRRQATAPTLTQASGNPSEIACPYEGWPLYFRARQPKVTRDGYLCLYAGHGREAVVACD